MKSIFTLLSLFISFPFIYGQNPAIEWQNTIGGALTEDLTSLRPTSDGGYIILGYSDSDMSGDKTENSNGGIDLWVVKVGSTGAIQWQNTIGGSDIDYGIWIEQTPDNGYIIGAGSSSNISGDKTENSRGGNDYWIIKLDEVGNIEWQKTYGGAQPEFETRVLPTSDGGYFVGGYSDSGVSGDKTEPSKGQRDYWALKLDSNGNIVWQKSIGGSTVDRLQEILVTDDGNYILAGYSNSGISGDKTEAGRGLMDYWIVKINTSGTIIWQKTIGGTGNDILRDIIQTSDGGYLVGGYSESNISGDKTENSRGGMDYWVVKLNAVGNIQWQKTIGSSGIDYLRSLMELNDGTYLISGYSDGGISGEKTVASNGGYDYWPVKISNTGAILGQTSIGGSLDESGGYSIPTADGGFVIGLTSQSNISGDKTEDSEGEYDYWIFKASSAILGIDEIGLGATKMSLYPNPNNGNFSISLGKTMPKVSTTTYNAIGQKTATSTYENTDTLNLTIEGASGIYFVVVSTPNGEKTTLKISKE